MIAPTRAEFEAALPEAWGVQVLQVGKNWIVLASNELVGCTTIGPKRKLVPADVAFLRSRVDDVIAPPLTYSQWLDAGRRFGFAGTLDDTPLTRGLRLLASCIERGDVDADDVAQALFRADTYTVNCPVAEASDYGRNVAELYALFAEAAKKHGQPLAWDDESAPEDSP